MALVDAYSPCPCGSGQKFKWCCQKAESHVDRALRLERNGQSEAALAVYNEAIAKFPDLALPRLRKAALLNALERRAEARECVGELLRKQPNHPGAANLNFRLLLTAGDVDAAVAEVQNRLANVEDEPLGAAESMTAVMGLALLRLGRVPAALKHLELVEARGAEADPLIESSLVSARSNPSTPAWLKNPYKLAPAPESADAETRGRFDEALGWAGKGLWDRAAAAFDLLSADPNVGLAADRNLGLCRLWLGDEPAAVQALRRAIAASPVSTDMVDLEALCQLLDDSAGDDPVEVVELSWPIRDREGLLTVLRADPRLIEDVDDQADESEPDDEAIFLLLDRPQSDAKEDLKATDLPFPLGGVRVGSETVAVNTRDDGRLNEVIDYFTAAAGQTIPPAHPRTKVIDSVSRGDLLLQETPIPPPGVTGAEARRLSIESTLDKIQSRWPETPMVYLDGKTPIEAGKSGGFEVPLRAALALFEEQDHSWSLKPDWPALRDRLGVPAEPAPDPIDVDIDATHLGRLKLIDPKGLQDDRLIQLYERAQNWGLPSAIIAAAKEIAERRRLLEREGSPLVEVFSDLALKAASDGDREAALNWITRGREVTPAARRTETAPMWDMLGVQAGMLLDQPEDWVPELVAVMDRHESDQPASRFIMSRLVHLGLLQMVSDPDRPGGMAVDPTPLYNLIARYGPRVQAVGGAGASGGGIWTPGSEAGSGGGGIWTPGSGAGAPPEGGAEKPRLILPGQ